MSSSTPKSIPRRAFGVISGLGLATILLLLLILLTWLATLEQIQHGLYATLDKYFNPKNFWVFPDAAVFFKHLEGAGKYLPPLPGGYWVCALLVVNLTLGGLIKLRKNPRTIGVLLAHFGILFMVVAGGVAQLRTERGLMMLSEKEGSGLPTTSDYAQSLTDTAVEVLEVDKDGKTTGQVHVIKDNYYTDLAPPKKAGKPQETRLISLPGLPFDLELSRYIQNADATAASNMPPQLGEPVVDGWYLRSEAPNKETERDTPGIHARVVKRDGTKGEPFLLVASNQEALQSGAPFTVHTDGRTFAVRMEKEIFHIPFKVHLVDARSENFPNTTKPKYFESDIMRIENGVESKVFIEMNAPMRYAGLTFYQHTMANGVSQDGGEATVSGFEVVRNPSDQWPKISIFVAGFGLCLHFVLKLRSFLMRGMKRPSNPNQAA